MFWCSVLSAAPDLDLLGGPLGIPYESIYAHRGALHSLVAAVAIGALAGLVGRRRGLPLVLTTVQAVLLVTSHSLLDMLNAGGKVAILWPFSDSYYRFFWRPIPSVIQLSDFLTPAGVWVVGAELLIFAPLFLWALWPWLRRQPH